MKAPSISLRTSNNVEPVEELENGSSSTEGWFTSGILGEDIKIWSPGDSLTKVASSRSLFEEAGIRVDSEDDSFEETEDVSSGAEVELAAGEL